MDKLLTAREAAVVLGVSHATLYSYVSRGLLASHQQPGRRASLYRHDDVLRLALRRRDGRHAGHVVEQAIDWGKPILESRITRIEHDTIRYRGHDAMALACGATLEQAALILWDADGLPSAEAPPTVDTARWRAMRLPFSAWPPLPRAIALLAAVAPAALSLADGAGRVAGAAQLMRLLAAALLDCDAGTAPLHQLCADAWGLDDGGASLVRAALVACADHELNVSAFTVRCVTSAGADLPNALLAGLTALSGAWHGGESVRARALIDAALGAVQGQHGESDDAALQALLADCLKQAGGTGFSGGLPGFGHPLYADGGDPRGRLLLALLERLDSPQSRASRVSRASPDRRAAPDAQQVSAPDAQQVSAPPQEIMSSAGRAPSLPARIARAGSALTGQAPNIDFALAAIEFRLALPRGAAQTLFALGRSAGWIAHAFEQRDEGRLIRPRARYVGHFDSPAGVAP